MKATIFIPYANGNCVTGFKYDKPMSMKQYVEMETKEYNDHYQGVDTMMFERYGDNMSINIYNKRQVKCQQQSYDFHQCDCNVLNMDGRQETLEQLQQYYQTGEQFILILNLNEKTLKSDADLETDLKMWFEESLKVKNCGRLSDEEVMFHLPKKDFKLKIVGLNETAILKDCKFLEFMSSSYHNSFAIIINKIIFVKE